MVEKRVGVRLVAEGGRIVRAEMQGLGAAGEKAFSDINRSARTAASGADAFDASIEQTRRGLGGYQGQVQNAAFQIGDFAVQVGAGTAASTALAQQLPQLLGGFGILGAVMGAVVAVAIPLGRYFLSSADAAKQLAETIDQARASFAGLESAYNALGSAQDGYTKAVLAGNTELAASYLELIALQEQAIELERAKAMAGLQDSREALRAAEEQVAAAQAVVDSFRAEQARRTDITSGFSVIDTESYAEASRLLAEATDAAGRLGVEVGIAETKVGILAQESAVATGEMNAAVTAANALSGGLAGAAGAAGGLLGNLTAVATAAWDAAAALAASANPYRAGNLALGDDGRGSQRDVVQDVNALRDQRNRAAAAARSAAYLRPPTSGGGSPSGGAAQSVVDEAEAAREAVDSILEDVAKKYEQAGKRGADAISDMLMGIVDGSKTAREALGDLLSQLAQVQIQRGILGLGESGGFLGGLLQSLGGALGANATGTNYWKGGPTWVGERGPEIVNLPRGAQVLSANNSAKMGGGNVTNFNIDARGAQVGVAEQIRAALEQYDRQKYQNARATSGDRRRVS